jgi:hypothetical protein
MAKIAVVRQSIDDDREPEALEARFFRLLLDMIEVVADVLKV